jgi:hypothetical protein
MRSELVASAVIPLAIVLLRDGLHKTEELQEAELPLKLPLPTTPS